MSNNLLLFDDTKHLWIDLGVQKISNRKIIYFPQYLHKYNNQGKTNPNQMNHMQSKIHIFQPKNKPITKKLIIQNTKKNTIKHTYNKNPIPHF